VLRDDAIDLPWLDGDPETRAFVDFWFGAQQQRDLRRLASVLHGRGEGDPLANALRLALSRTIVTKEPGAVPHEAPPR
jgi:hypothetical protein